MAINYRETIEKIIKEIIKRIDNEINQFYDEKGVDTNSKLRKIKKSYDIREVPHKVIFLNYNFIYYFYWWNYGRKPSEKYPPYEPINNWVRKKLKPMKENEKSTTFAVMTKIKKYGFEGKHMFDNLNEKIKTIINDVINEHMNSMPSDDRLRFMLYLCGDILTKNIIEMIENNTYKYTIHITL